MNIDPGQQPYVDPSPDELGATPHLSDYWTVIARRLWLVLVIFTVTTASSIFKVSQSRTTYTATVALQVNDPQERAGGLVNIPSVGGLNLFVDPIESEIQVLRSATIRTTVVDSLGMRLARVPVEDPRSLIVRDVWVSADVPDYQPYRLIYNADGTHARFIRVSDDVLIGEAPAGTRLVSDQFRFTVMGIPDEEPRAFDLSILPGRQAAGEIVFSATSRLNTDIVDVTMVHHDAVLVVDILNAGGQALRDYGAEKVREGARLNEQFIQQRLDSSNAQLLESRDDLRDFKTTRQVTTLSVRERNLATQSERISQQREGLQDQRMVLRDLSNSVAALGLEGADLSAVLAELPPNSNRQVTVIIGNIQARQVEEATMTEARALADGHPEVIAKRAQIDTLAAQLRQATNASLNVVQRALDALEEDDIDLKIQMAEFPELESGMATLEAQVRIDMESHQFILSQLYQAQITRGAAAPYVDILDPATGSSTIPGRGRIAVGLGALLGLILGVGAAFFLEYLDRTVRTSSDVESLLGIPVLGVIPTLRRLDDDLEGADLPGRGRPLVVAMDPLDPAAEAYRNLRMNLMFMSSDEEPIRTVLFSSPGPSEGKSTTAVNFAVMLAQQGQRVLLIDADLRRPSLHRALDLLREPGLTNLLIGDAEPRETVRPNVLPNLDFLPSGPFPPNPSELLNSKTMALLIEEFEGRYDQVIIDSPPVLAVTDAAILAVHTDGVVIVLRSGETEQRAAERSVDQLRRLGVRVFGAVLNAVSTANPDESYYLQYYYSYTPTGTPTQSGWERLRDGMSKVKFFQ